jgi:alanine racemase
MRPTTVTIHRSAFVHNLQLVQHYAPNSKIIAVIKANAYGHGAEKLAPVAIQNGAKALAVCSLEEALVIRKVEPHVPIVVLEGFFSVAEIPEMIAHKLIAVVHSPKQVAMLTEQHYPGLAIMLKLDSGMHRLGLIPSEFITAVVALQTQYPIVALISHFANADAPEHALNVQQQQVFDDITWQYPYPNSLANSAAILRLPQSHRDWVRPGIMLYGSNPLLHGEVDVKPVMHCTTELIAVHTIKSGESVGYGSTWQCQKKNCRIGVAAVGYADGYPRHAPSGTPVAVNGKIVPLAGRVSMDMITLDLSSLPKARVGDPVELWGDVVSADTVARQAGTIAYELFCGISGRVRRVWVE